MMTLSGSKQTHYVGNTQINYISSLELLVIVGYSLIRVHALSHEPVNHHTGGRELTVFCVTRHAVFLPGDLPLLRVDPFSQCWLQ